MRVAIRSAAEGDETAIASVTATAFLHAPHSSHTEQFIVNALSRANALTVSLVALDDARIVGHVAVSPVTVSDGANGWYGLGPISILPQYQGRRIGSQLMEASLQRLKELGAKGCVLLGDPGYYKRFGFKCESRLVLPDVPPEYFQALSFSDSVPQGTVAYHNAFGAKS